MLLLLFLSLTVTGRQRRAITFNLLVSVTHGWRWTQILLFIHGWKIIFTIQFRNKAFLLLEMSSAGLMPTEARGNYLPEAPYVRETKTYLNCNSRMQCVGTSNMHDYQHNTTMSVQFSSSLVTHFNFFVADVMSNYLTTDGLKKFSLLPEAPLRPEAFATSATWLIRHWKWVQFNYNSLTALCT